MTEDTIRTITTGRLSGWADKLVSDHATPALLIGFGHDHRSGDVVLCCVEDLSDEDVRDLLRGLLRKLGG